MKMHEVVIERSNVCTLRDIFAIKGVADFKIIRMSGENGQQLKPFEAMAGRKLGREDAVVISRYTKKEIEISLTRASTDSALRSFRSEQTKEGIRNYNIHYCSDDPICIETIDYMLPESVDTSSSFNGDYRKIVQDACLDNARGITDWIYESQEPFLEFRTIEDNYIGSGMIRRDDMIREIQTKNVVVVLERNDECDFLITTAYPDITERAVTAVPTGRDIRPALHESNAYKQGDDTDRYLLDQKILNGITH